MNKVIEALKKLWDNPVVKIMVLGAGGATGGVLAVPGTIILDKAHIIASVTGALLSLWGLFTQHPTNPAPKQ